MKFLVFLNVIILLCACNNKKVGQEPLTAAKLTAPTLYNIDSVRYALKNSSPAERDSATKKFLEAIDMYKNQNRVFMSIQSFKKSLYLSPSEKTYFELANALVSNLNYSEALQSLHIAELLDYSPLSRIMYQTASIYSIMPGNKYCSDNFTKWNDSLALHYMEIALQMGYPKPKDFLEDKAFDSLRLNNDWHFKTIYETALGGTKDPLKLVWENYKTGFKPIKLPLNINTPWIYQKIYDNAIGYDFEKFVPEMRTGKFSREVDNEYYYVGRVKEDSAYSALLYAGKNMWIVDGRGYSPIYFYLVTYSDEGKIIDKMQVAGQKTFSDNFKTFIIKENMTFEVKAFKNIYEKDPDKEGYENNNIVKSDPISANYFTITPLGKIRKLSKDAVSMR